MKSQTTKFILVLFVALVLRMAGIFSRPIWYDEAFSILFAEKGLGDMLYGTLSQTGTGAADIHPLGYYTILWGWMKIFGRSIQVARSLSILTSIISLYLVYRIGILLFNRNTASIAASLFSILPFQIHYAQEIRMYAPLSMWLLLATYSFLQGRKGGWKWWLVFGISSALAQYTHNLAAFYLIPLTFTPILQRDWKTLRPLIVAGLGAIILYLPWLIFLPDQVSKVASHYWVQRPGIEKILILILFYIPHLPIPENLLLLAMLLAALTIALAIYQTYLSWKTNLQGSYRGVWLAYIAFAPPLLLWITSLFVSVYIERALLPSHAIFCIWLAWVITQMKTPRVVQILMTGFIIVCAAIGIQQHITYDNFPYAPFKEIGNYLESKIEEDDLVIHSSKLSYLPMLYYHPTLEQGYIIDPPGSNVDTLAPATRDVLSLQEYENIEPATFNLRRIWFVIYQNSVDEYIHNGYIDHPHLEYLNDNFELESAEIWEGINLYLYTKKAQ